ncbi:MAG: hypothetical protein WDM81_17670 [Rhizomicrobium sp.]
MSAWRWSATASRRSTRCSPRRASRGTFALVTPHFIAALAAVAATDMVTTLSAALARRFASSLGLVLRDAPLGETRIETTLVCSHIRSADSFYVWFRALVRDVASPAMKR